MDRSWLKGRRIALGVGGGIAAYKACDLIRELRRAGAQVRVAMTPAAREFITPLTMQALCGHPVLTESFDPVQETSFGHLHLARWADAFVIAPATADLIARIHAGIANDVVTTPLLAFRGPVLLAPAMNTVMWENARTQENLAALLAEPRYRKVGPNVGLLADGDVGAGRLAELAELVDAVARLGSAGRLFGKKVLITAGPTREHLDPVRFLSNPSTGKMGLAMAEEARARGASVTVVLGPVAGAAPEGLEVVPVTTAEQMAAEVLSRVDEVDFFVAAAAVSDWRPETIAAQKVKKTAAPQTLTLVRTPDVLAEASARVHARPQRPRLIGFAAETEQVIANAREKLGRKQLDFIVANDVSAPGSGFAGDANQVVVLSAAGSQTPISGAKREVAAGIWDLIDGAGE
ncbi:MAG: Phosphopantothenoylcysteine decarboxylase [Myxococcaceae bacterium]|nr:Phosphopantothenoylcysteine decarboxylase [Myxococcaceae bacterium]